MLADILTMTEHSPKPLSAITFCYLGDARNNTAHSLLVTGALLGMDVRIAALLALQPTGTAQDAAHTRAGCSGARITVTEDVTQAVRKADYLYTDVWLSMREPVEQWSDRIRLSLPYQVTAAILEATRNPGVRFMHCLPALHDRHTDIGLQLVSQHGLDALEVTDEVLESPSPIVFDRAENRLHTIKAIMVATLGD